MTVLACEVPAFQLGKNRRCQVAEKSIFFQIYLHEQLYISVPVTHPLAVRRKLKAADLRGVSLLTFDVGFWVDLCRSRMPDTPLLIQTDPDTMDELVAASSLLVFNSDQMLADGYVPDGRVNLMLEEDIAYTSYYVACLDAEKEQYASSFNAVRAEVNETGL